MLLATFVQYILKKVIEHEIFFGRDMAKITPNSRGVLKSNEKGMLVKVDHAI